MDVPIAFFLIIILYVHRSILKFKLDCLRAGLILAKLMTNSIKFEEFSSVQFLFFFCETQSNPIGLS